MCSKMMNLLDVPNKVIREQKKENKEVLENKSSVMRTSTSIINTSQIQSKNQNLK